MTPSIPFYRRTRWLTYFALALVAVGSVLALYGYTAFVKPQPWTQVNRTDLANLGSYLQGAVGSLWSLAAFIFVYVAFLGQQEELEDNRNRARIDNETAVRQRFETSFFELLGLHRRIVDRVNARDQNNGSIVGGNEAFRIWVEVLQRRVRTADPIHIPVEYKVFFIEDDAQSELGHYFRNLYHLVRFVHESEAGAKEKPNYMKFVRAQLSSAEIILLFYNGLSEYGRKRFRPLIIDYSLLEQLPKDEINPRHLRKYPKRAYKDPLLIPRRV